MGLGFLLIAFTTNLASYVWYFISIFQQSNDTPIVLEISRQEGEQIFNRK